MFGQARSLEAAQKKSVIATVQQQVLKMIQQAQQPTVASHRKGELVAVPGPVASVIYVVIKGIVIEKK